jgi:guanylate kinase
LAASGKHIFLDIDVNGALQVKKKYPGQAVTIFIAPPSTEELVRRLKNRKSESEEEIHRRLARLPMEMEKSALFDFRIINEDADQSAHEVLNILGQYDPSLVAPELGNPVSAARN